ncbi:allophanate hydrolase [Clostridia bacterium]|nr:allophanate hydrolase [Clostridia bacterium]
MIAKKLTIDYLKKGYLRGEFTVEDICREIIKRADAARDMNIWIVPPDMSLIMPYLEQLKSCDITSLPLWGIPFAVKDNIDVANVPTTAGCKTYAYTPDESATVVQLLIEAGAIPIGKTNLDQFATGLVGTRSIHGAVHNALNAQLISGGSSSGSAVAVAVGQAAFSLGTDTAGSGRVPAALNNLVGLKPTCGAWSTTGVVPACESLDCVTVFTHILSDADAVDKILRVHDIKCGYSKQTNQLTPKLPKKICIPAETPEFYGTFEKEYRSAWERALEKIKSTGIPVEPIDCGIFKEAAAMLYDGPWIAERWSSLGEFVTNNNGRGMVEVTESILKSGNRPELRADDVFRVIHRLAQIKAETRELLADSVLILPTAGGTYTIEQVNADPVRTNSNMGLYTNHCNLLDLSALNFPAGWADENLPFGITSFALSGEDGLNVGLAQAYELHEMIPIAVCGLHMRGMPLEHQLTDLGAIFIRESATTAEYKLYKLNTTPVKPGLVRVADGGTSIALELWNIPAHNLGAFVTNISSPLGLGKIALESGEYVTGFVCESYAAADATDVSHLKSFRNVLRV